MLELSWEVYRTDEQEEYEKEIGQLKTELLEIDYYRGEKAIRVTKVGL